jgi:capsular exopolysaccharide synthesis family protein
MGYIFDALNRSDDEQRRHPTPTPEPAPLDAGPSEAPQTPEPAIDDAFASLEDLEAMEPDPPVQADPPERTADARTPANADADPASTLAIAPSADDDAPRSVGPPHATTAEDDADAMIDSDPAPRRATGEPLHGIDERLVLITQPGSIMAEQYRSIRTTQLARWQNKRHLLHTITSATPQEGKTITSLNLGLSFAELRNRRTLVLECDLRLPTIAKLLNLPPALGFTDYLRGRADADDIFRPVGDTGLTVVCAGSRADTDAVQLLHSPSTNAFLARVREQFDHVIIDTPPVVELADAGILGAQSDEVLLVSRMNRTPRELIEQAINTLQSYQASVAGMIATDQQRTRRRSYQYRYGYRYHYGQSTSRRQRKAA